MKKLNLSNSLQLFDQAKSIIPGGVWGHNKYPASLDHGHYPYFVRSGKGAYFKDIDGNSYIDYVCGYGSMVNGYSNFRINQVASSSQKRGNGFPQPTQSCVKLTKFLISKISGIDWCAFGKNGSDATTIAVTIARAHTKKRKLLCVKGGYNGTHFWCNWCNIGEGRGEQDSSDIVLFEWNDVKGFEKEFNKNKDDLAGIIMTPFHHPIPGKSILPSEEFIQTIQKMADKERVPIILDDVRTGFRMHPNGSHEYIKLKPSLICLSKALANTYPLSVVGGDRCLMPAAESIFVNGTFWNSSMEMDVALENLKMLYSYDSIGYMMDLGKLLVEGLICLGVKYKYKIEFSGIYSIPTITFYDDPDFLLMKQFSRLMVLQGSFVHPMHNWFISTAHKRSDIEKTLMHAERAFSCMVS